MDTQPALRGRVAPSPRRDGESPPPASEDGGGPRRNRIFGRRRLAARRTLVSHLAVLALAGLSLSLVSGRIAGGVTTAGVLTPPGLTYRAVMGQSTGTQGGGDFPVRTGAAAAAPTPAPFMYIEHEVKEGETLSSIAAEYGVELDYLIWNNPEVADPDLLLVGEKLVIPGTSGIIYHVRLGDTLTDIAATYGIEPEAVTEFAPNNLESPDFITEGMVLVLPGAVPPPPVIEPPAPPAEAPISGAEPALVSEPTPPPVPPVLAQPAAAPLPPASASFIWPVAGSVNSQFGPRWGGFHSGIDIGAPYGTAVGAAAGGQVVLTVYSDVGFGYHVVIRHDDGSETLYAHLSAIYVGLGQYVAQGEAIGAVGCTGWCTGNHLHFEVHIGGTPVNPLLYLP